MAKEETLAAVKALGGKATCYQVTEYLASHGYDVCAAAVYGYLLKLEHEGTLTHNMRTRIFSLRNYKPQKNIVELQPDGKVRQLI